MKKLLPMFAVLLLLPSVSSAAALTTQQSASLIAVVQSSPGIPASAFISLITAFSNITVNQAASLITVVQAAPSAPANAFVNLLTSFTVDTPTPPVTVVPTVTIQTTQINQQTIQPVTPVPISTTQTNQQTTQPTQAPVQVAPVMELKPMDTTLPLFVMFSVDNMNGEQHLRIASDEPLDFSKTVLPQGITMEIIYDGRQDGKAYFGRPRVQKNMYGYDAKLTGASGTFSVEVQDMAGNVVTRTVTAMKTVTEDLTQILPNM